MLLQIQIRWTNTHSTAPSSVWRAAFVLLFFRFSIGLSDATYRKSIPLFTMHFLLDRNGPADTWLQSSKARPKNRKNKIHKAKSDPIISRFCVPIEVKFATNSVFESLAVRQSTRHRISLCVRSFHPKRLQQRTSMLLFCEMITLGHGKKIERK